MIKKFKAWDKKNERMYYSSGFTISQIVEASESCIDSFWFDEETCIWLQFTNKKDKDDVEIYESDLITNGSGRISKVTFQSHACFDCIPVVVTRNDNSDGGKCYDWPYRMEVIGNIYENPELLKP